MEAVARAARDPLVGPLKLGVIPTVAPYLMPLILKPLKQGYPGLTIELWEDQTRALVEGLRNHKLDAALLATETDAPEITEIELFDEPLLAALPRNHKLAGAKKVDEEALTGELLVLADGHCLTDAGACGLRSKTWRARDGTFSGRAAGVDASSDAGDAGEPGGGGVRCDADPGTGGWVIGAEGDCAASAGGKVAEDDPAGKPAGVSQGAGLEGDREGDPECGKFFVGFGMNSGCNRACGKLGRNSIKIGQIPEKA